MLARFTKLVALACAGALLPVTGFAAPATAQRVWTPTSGITLNNPIGTLEQRWAIHNKITRSIDNSPKGSEIHIFSWNFMTREGASKLLAAQRRGVRVRLLMSAANVSAEVPNPVFRYLQRGLKAGNEGRKKSRRSWARVCQGACRGGTTGEPHSKFFLFSQVGKAKDIFMQGSANFTKAAAFNQWNDMVTHTNSPRIYDWALDIFKEAAKDRRADPVFRSLRMRTRAFYMFPRAGAKADPPLDLISKVRCLGATNTTTGRTIIRILPDVVRNKRGTAFARQVKALWDRGCDIRLGYTVMGVEQGRILRARTGRGPVPLRHLVQDFDLDGQFDNYFHLKAIVVVGRVGNSKSAYYALNGSANISGLSSGSDENIGIYTNVRYVRRYLGFANYWWDRFGAMAQDDVLGKAVTRNALQRQAGSSGLIFGTGRNLTDEFGNPIHTDVDPYAQLERD